MYCCCSSSKQKIPLFQYFEETLSSLDDGDFKQKRCQLQKDFQPVSKKKSLN
jgi:hypothetical protein